MKILHKYISRKVSLMITLTMITVLGIDIFFSMIYESSYLGRGDYDGFVLLQILLLSLPAKIYRNGHWCFLIGTMLALSDLTDSHEATTVRLFYSIPRITWISIQGSTLLLSALFIIGEIAVPPAERLAHQIRVAALSRGQTIVTETGFWTRQENTFVHIAQLDVTDKITGLTRYHIDGDALSRIEFAQEAQRHGSTWIAPRMQQTYFAPTAVKRAEQGHVSIPAFTVHTKQQEKHLEYLSLPHLYCLQQKLQHHALADQKYALAFWRKLWYPVAIIAMLMASIPPLFGPMRDRSKGLKVIFGIGIGFSFYFCSALMSPVMLIHGLSPCLAAALPALVILGVSLWRAFSH